MPIKRTLPAFLHIDIRITSHAYDMLSVRDVSVLVSPLLHINRYVREPMCVKKVII